MYNKSELKHFLETLIGYDKDVEKEIDVSGAVIFKRGEQGEIIFLLIKRSETDLGWPNQWEIPRGKCDKSPKEKIDSCLKREVKEEVGVTIKVLSYLDKYTYVADKGTRRSTQYNFLCSLDPPEQEIKLSKEHSEYQWVTTIGETDLYINPRELRDTLELAIKRINEE